MSSPRTLSALRAAVARVLQARGEAADALVCDVEWSRTEGHYATVSVVACNVNVEWFARGSGTRADAIGNAWRNLVSELEREHESAKRAAASTRRPERKAAAGARYSRARAALAVAREIGGDGA